MTEKTRDAIHSFLQDSLIIVTFSELIQELETQAGSGRLKLSNHINLDLHVYGKQRNKRQAVQKMQISWEARASVNQVLQMQI